MKDGDSVSEKKNLEELVMKKSQELAIFYGWQKLMSST